MKKLSRDFMQVAHIFWLKHYEGDTADKMKKYHSLSVNAKWLYMTLKHLENRFTGENNSEENARKLGIMNDYNAFTCENSYLAVQAGMSESSVKRAKKELEDAGLIIVEKDHYKAKSGKISSVKVSKYRLLDGVDFTDKVYENNYDKKVNIVPSKNNPIGKPGYIYVMKCMGYYKIGKSKDCRRLGEYTKLPEEPEYVMIEYVSNMDLLERFLHDLYASKRLREGSCEWFNLSDDDLITIRESLKPHIVIDTGKSAYIASHAYHSENKYQSKYISCD